MPVLPKKSQSPVSLNPDDAHSRAHTGGSTVRTPSRRLTLAAIFSSTLGVGLIFGIPAALDCAHPGPSGLFELCDRRRFRARSGRGDAVRTAVSRVIVRFGLKRCIVAGVVFAAALLLLMPLWPSIASWLLLRFLAGCALDWWWIASEIWMNNASGPESRGARHGDLWDVCFPSASSRAPFFWKSPVRAGRGLSRRVLPV